jgi:hypothetical protein
MNLTGLLVIPVSGSETVSLRSGRLPTGERVGIAFSTESRLRQVMGASQRWILISESAMKAMLAPLGIVRVQVDPGLIAPPVTPITPGVPCPRTVLAPAPAPSPKLVKEFT